LFAIAPQPLFDCRFDNPAGVVAEVMELINKVRVKLNGNFDFVSKAWGLGDGIVHTFNNFI
jgi:hypothetical protein